MALNKKQLPLCITAQNIKKMEKYTTDFLSLHHCDCMELMKQYPDKYFDLALVDPPYGIGASSIKFINRTSKTVKPYYKENCWDTVRPTEEYFNELKRVSKNQIIWGGNYFADYLGAFRCFICWDKTIHGNSYADCELAWTSFDKVARYYRKNIAQVNSEGRIHPTQKPITLYDFVLKEFAEKGNLILDTHFGSGSIALAVHKANQLDKMNLHLTACEIDLDYVNASIKRISNYLQQTTLNF